MIQGFPLRPLRLEYRLCNQGVRTSVVLGVCLTVSSFQGNIVNVSCHKNQNLNILLYMSTIFMALSYVLLIRFKPSRDTTLHSVTQALVLPNLETMRVVAEVIILLPDVEILDVYIMVCLSLPLSQTSKA